MASFDKILTKVFGSSNERFLKTVNPLVAQINEFEPAIKQLTDEQLREKTVEYKAQIADAVKDARDKDDRKYREQQVLNEILPEAFAVVREASVRTTGMRHFDVQMIGGLVLHQGKIAEMRTGEGKTLVATLPAYLNALTGRGVHIITVNDYLASRDAEWMGQIHRFLGLTVGCIQNDMDDFERQTAYNADITYGTNNEFGFDYLRDNMKFDLATCVQRGHYHAIVDEVDSILIDEARTPLIISGPSEESTDKYYQANAIIPQLIRGEELEENKKTGDYVVDEKNHSAVLTEDGVDKAERLLGVGNLYDPGNMELLHCVEQALKAHTLYRLDHQYVVQEGEVIIVDDFTGRLMKGRRWSDGLHQAVEAKEGVKIERENQTLATITLQNYFRLYEKLSGMTGTAETEAAEFHSTYKLDVIVIPTHMPMVRKDNPDVIYRTLPEKWDAVVEEIKDLHEKGQLVLVGHISVENSELIARKLQRIGVPHNVLNAKYHEREAEIVAQAGRKGMVTIATNMAGRGTDILLGGNPDFMAKQECVKKGIAQPLRAAQGKIQIGVDDSKSTVWYYAGNEYVVPTDQWNEAFSRYKQQTDKEHDEVTDVGGLFILGTERHEARRIDNQLRGRAGRQGDPGASRFYLSLEDDLMRIFAKEWVSKLLERLGMEEGVPIESKLISRRIEKAQEAVEAQHFESRKHLLEYDDVMNKQHEADHGLRRQLLEGVDQKDLILEDYVSGILGELLEQHCQPKVHPEDWDLKGLKDAIFTRFGVDILAEGIKPETLNRQELGDAIFERLKERYDAKEKLIGPDAMRYHERMIMLSVLDAQWKDHLLGMDHLKEGIGLRGYGQHDPLVDYKKESFDMFEAMMQRFQEDTVRYLYLMQILERPPDAVAGGPPATEPSRQGPEGGVPVHQGGDGNGRRPARMVSTSADD